MGGGTAVPIAGVVPVAANQAHAQILMRLSHDLRRLKEIASIERKVDAKREMLPTYFPWIEGLLQAADATGEGTQDEVLPTIMVWLIDTGDFAKAMTLAEYVLRFDVALPSRYARSAPALIAEEIAMAALKAQLAGKEFPLEILEHVDMLTANRDMHDEIRAKLQKAIGFELAREAEGLEAGDPNAPAAAERALIPLRRAQELHDRAGAKDKIRRLEKLLVSPAPPAPPEPNTAGTSG